MKTNGELPAVYQRDKVHFDARPKQIQAFSFSFTIIKLVLFQRVERI